MKEELAKIINPFIKELNMFVDDVYYEEVEGVNNLNIVLDSEEIIDIEKITEASRIINPIIDEMDLGEDSFVLDIHSKEKGSDINE